MAIPANLVRELRERTGAAMMDCKKALEATGGDLEAGVDHLRKQGLKSAAKKASRETAEGRVFGAVADGGKRGHMVGVACETDFLAKGDNFVGFVTELADHVSAQDPDSVDDGERPLVSQSWMGAGATVGEKIQEAVGHFGENIQITQLVRHANPEGLVGTYVHHDKKQGAIVSVTTSAAGAANEVLNALCQHIVVFRPTYANREDVPVEEVERERAVIRESEEVKKKPAEYQDKIIDGKMNKFYAGTVLAEQPWIHDDKSTVDKALAKELGDARIEAFALVRLGGG